MNPRFLNTNSTAYHYAALLSYKCYFMPFFIPLYTKSVSNTGQGKTSPNHLEKAEGVDVFSIHILVEQILPTWVINLGVTIKPFKQQKKDNK